MPKPQGTCDALLAWLRANLGRAALAPLTGTDGKALAAAVHIVELYAYDSDPSVLVAFRVVVVRMQPSTRHLAYHAIAHVLDWPDRDRIWALAGLLPMRADIDGVLSPGVAS